MMLLLCMLFVQDEMIIMVHFVVLIPSYKQKNWFQVKMLISATGGEREREGNHSTKKNQIIVLFILHSMH
jgi:dolichol kinase